MKPTTNHPGLSRPFRDTVIERIRKDPEFAKLLFAERVDELNKESGKEMMRQVLDLFIEAYE